MNVGSKSTLIGYQVRVACAANSYLDNRYEEVAMKMKTIIDGSVLLLSIAMVGSASAKPPPGPIGSLYGLRICKGTYALCAASTCTPNGHMIQVNVAGGGTALFPEASCKCPVYTGAAIADPDGGNMKGTCEPPGPGRIWSLYFPRSHIPQAINGWRRTPEDTEVDIQLCSASENVR